MTGKKLSKEFEIDGTFQGATEQSMANILIYERRKIVEAHFLNIRNITALSFLH